MLTNIFETSCHGVVHYVISTTVSVFPDDCTRYPSFSFARYYQTNWANRRRAWRATTEAGYCVTPDEMRDLTFEMGFFASWASQDVAPADDTIVFGCKRITSLISPGYWTRGSTGNNIVSREVRRTIDCCRRKAVGLRFGPRAAKRNMSTGRKLRKSEQDVKSICLFSNNNGQQRNDGTKAPV